MNQRTLKMYMTTAQMQMEICRIRVGFYIQSQLEQDRLRIIFHLIRHALLSSLAMPIVNSVIHLQALLNWLHNYRLMTLKNLFPDAKHLIEFPFLKLNVSSENQLGVEEVAGARVVVQARRCVKHVLGL